MSVEIKEVTIPSKEFALLITLAKEGAKMSTIDAIGDPLSCLLMGAQAISDIADEALETLAPISDKLYHDHKGYFDGECNVHMKEEVLKQKEKKEQAKTS